MRPQSAQSWAASASTAHPAVVGYRNSLHYLSAINRLYRDQLSKWPDRAAGKRVLTPEAKRTRVRTDRPVVHGAARSRRQFLHRAIVGGDDVGDVGRKRIHVGRDGRL